VEELAGWVAPAATMIAAIMTAANLGTRVTGWGFAVFSVGAIAWMIVGAASGQQNLLLSNAFLLLVDLVGVWRWLGRQARYEAGAEAAMERSAAPLFAASRLVGMPVRDAAGSPIASVVEAMAHCRDGAVAYLVVREGGVAGVGERLHALRWDEVRAGAGALDPRLPAAALAARRALTPEQWPTTVRAAGLD
jgi:hypothetical protein